MNIEYRRVPLTEDGLGPEEGPFLEPLGYVLFVEKACYFGVLPPIEILNEMFNEGSIVSNRNFNLLWSPFKLSNEEYRELVTAVETHPEWGGEVDTSFNGVAEDWGHWALIRSMEKFDSQR
ncbi:hypothetical protein QWI17_11050 [Gilvimarinus sp. SDUM040013]|uniref:Uncharacterized protein n=1 Tax=Gilvimarinus gilvus TaxID=3058038 RepID=A0ABU4RZP6_9GAMM|nr:hypothetical protein [Gilvimarinus sp. SDUM040013]MDO3386375.1 hypothetical protein [Gilvimarinus sp. SDUM040013]MDX6849641.1 hypothetical protein [Gilvimarinus sp. SDUM040013]